MLGVSENPSNGDFLLVQERAIPVGEQNAPYPSIHRVEVKIEVRQCLQRVWSVLVPGQQQELFQSGV